MNGFTLLRTIGFVGLVAVAHICNASVVVTSETWDGGAVTGTYGRSDVGYLSGNGSTASASSTSVCDPSARPGCGNSGDILAEANVSASLNTARSGTTFTGTGSTTAGGFSGYFDEYYYGTGGQSYQLNFTVDEAYAYTLAGNIVAPEDVTNYATSIVHLSMISPTPTGSTNDFANTNGAFSFSGLLTPGAYTLWGSGEVVRGTSYDSGYVNFPVGDTTASFTYSLDLRPVPLPAAVWLFGSALAGLVGVGSRRDRVVRP